MALNSRMVYALEGQSDHGLDPVQRHLDDSVIVRALGRRLTLVRVPAAQYGQMVPEGVVGLPHGGQAGGLGGHHVDPGAVIHGQALYARSKELHDGVLHHALLEGGLHQRQRHVLRAHTGPGRPGEVDGDHLRIGDVIGFFQQLPGQLGPALADGHRPVSAVTGVGIGSQDHFAGGGVAFPHIGVDHALVGGDELAAVLLGGGQAEDVIVLVDGTAHGAQRIVTVGQHIGHREFRHAGGTGRLDDAHIGNVVGGHGVKSDRQLFHAPRRVVLGQDGIGHGPLFGFLRCGQPGGGAFPGREKGAVFVIDALALTVQHIGSLQV